MARQYDLFGLEHLALEMFVSRDSARHALSGICLERGRAIASDGRVLLVVPSTRVDAEELPANVFAGEPLSGRVVVQPGALKKAFSFAPRNPALPNLRGVVASECAADFEWEDNGRKGKVKILRQVTLTATDLETTGAVKTRPVEATFPDVDQVVPKPEDRPYKVTLNSRLLKKVAGFAEKVGHGKLGAPIRFGFDPKDADACVRMDIPLADGRVATGAVMPMKDVGVTPEPKAAEKSEKTAEPEPATQPAKAAKKAKKEAA